MSRLYVSAGFVNGELPRVHVASSDRRADLVHLELGDLALLVPTTVARELAAAITDRLGEQR